MTASERYADRKARRVCQDCEDKLAGDDGARCRGCAKYRSELMAEVRRERLAAKVCTRCRAPVLEGSEFCGPHDEAHRTSSRNSWRRLWAKTPHRLTDERRAR